MLGSDLWRLQLQARIKGGVEPRISGIVNKDYSASIAVMTCQRGFWSTDLHGLGRCLHNQGTCSPCVLGMQPTRHAAWMIVAWWIFDRD